MSGRAGNGAMSPQPNLTEIRKQLFARGYKILPNRGKAPVIKGWSDPDYLARELTDSSKGTVPEKIEHWPGRFPDALSTGVCLWNKLRVIDIDVSDATMVEALLDAIRKLAPEIADRAPMRYGATPKVALFVRADDDEEPMKLFDPAGDLIDVRKTTFIRKGSPVYRRPGEAEDAPTHRIEIFGGAPTPKGKCSRQFGVYGPHSYNDDGTVAREYAWAADRPALHEIDLADLPTLSCEVAYKIIDGFERLANEVGWVKIEPSDEGGGGDLIYDIDETTRFDLDTGGQVSYAELCEEFDPSSDHLRCASSFITGDAGSNRSKCHVFWSPRHDCVAIYNYETAAKHYPKDKAPVEDGSKTPLGEFLRKLRDKYGDDHARIFGKPVAMAGTASAQPLPALQWLDMSNWDNELIPKRKWAIKDLVPLNQVGLFSGEGGTGKSIIELMKNVAHVAKGDWFGSQPEQGPTFYLGAEDDTDELHIRLAYIAKHYGVSFRELVKDGLHVLPLLGKDAVLCAANPKSGRVEVTELYEQIYEAAGDLKPINISVDTLSRAFAGNEIDRVQVYTFAMHMQALAKVAGGSVTILSHPSLAGMASGSGISGSTAWHGAFRFRQYLKGVKADVDDGEQPDNDLRELEFKKNQYGPLGPTIVLRYQNGLFLPEIGVSDIDKAARTARAESVFMDLLRRFTGQGNDVSNKPTSPYYAPKTFAKEAEAQKYKFRKNELEAAMRRLFATNKIHVESHGKPSRLSWRLAAGPKPAAEPGK